MSAEANLVFFGLRFDLAEQEVSQGDIRRHPIVVRARSVGLEHYMGNFGGSEPLYYLFIGKRIGITGAENEVELVVAANELASIVAETQEKLQDAGFDGPPMLYVNWIADA
jgi:phosphopantetheine adenylyltransferase